jgi:hypothetical protein
MLPRLAAILILASLGYGCDCYTQDVQQSRKFADVIFEGKIIAFRDSGVDRTVVFNVDRVWKGDVSATFEMLAWDGGNACESFPYCILQIGNQLLVYAHRLVETLLITGPCSRTPWSATRKTFSILAVVTSRKPGKGACPASEVVLGLAALL